MSSQGAAAVTALRARRSRRRYLRAFWGDNSEESRDPGDFKERWTSFRICLDRRPPGTKQRLWSKPGAESERASELWGGASQKKRKHSRATHNGSQDGNQATGRTQTIDFQAEIYTRVWGRPAAASLCSSLLTGLAFNKCIISKETELDNDVYSEEVWCCVASVKLCQRFSSRPRPAAVTSRESSPDRPCRLYSCFKKGRKCVWVEAASSQL